METIPLIGTSIWIIVKIFFLIALVIYLIFALVVIKQVNIMTDTLDLSFEIPVKVLAYLHFLFALGVLVIAFLIL
ncbi:MAG TPA: DUF5657 family protein [Patescibacteria group bacterium]